MISHDALKIFQVTYPEKSYQVLWRSAFTLASQSGASHWLMSTNAENALMTPMER